MSYPHLNLITEEYFEIHKERLKEHTVLIYQGVKYYLGKKGGVYYRFLQEQEFIFKIIRVQISNKMIKKEDNIRSESYYPDSNYYIDQENISKENPLSEDQISNMGEIFEWPNSYWFIAERTNGRLAMIGFMAVIINYSLFGWIAYPIL